MNDEKRNHPPDLLPGEERLSQLYQAASKEVPPPGLDATILDAARQTVYRKPRRVYFLASRKWTVPLSLAAAFIVTIGVVQSLRHEMESPVPTAPMPSSPHSSTALPLDNQANLKRQEQTLSQAKETPPEVDQTLQPLEKMADTDSKTLPSSPTPVLPTLAERQVRRDALPLQTQEQPRPVPPPAPSLPSSALAPDISADQGRANVGGLAAKPQSQAPEQEQSLQRSAPQKEVEGTSSPRRSEDDLRSVGAREKRTKAETLKKDTQSPEEWIAEIKKLRQAGKLTEAEASLKAFKQRYPDYLVEKALAPSHTSHDVPKGTQ